MNESVSESVSELRRALLKMLAHLKNNNNWAGSKGGGGNVTSVNNFWVDTDFHVSLLYFFILL